jgi:hypothetical protein
MTSPGLARLRAHPAAESVRAQVLRRALVPCVPYRRHILRLLLKIDRIIGQGFVVSYFLSRIWAMSCVRAVTALAAVAIVAGGCASAYNAASSQAEQPYRTAYGTSSAGFTTSLYDELFGSSKSAAATAAAEPVQPTSAALRQVQPALAPAQVAQQPATPAAPPEPAYPTAYGISSKPTTDLYTELFGPRRPNGQ